MICILIRTRSKVNHSLLLPSRFLLCDVLNFISNYLFPAFVAYHYFRGLLAYQENAPISFLSSKADKAGAKTDLQKFLARYKLILQLQTEVVTFLLEKFALTSPRVKYVQETMEFVKEQIKILERASSSSSSEEWWEEDE